MALSRDRAICLRKVEYSETSQILQLFTRGHGILRVLAKGAHRRTKAGASKFDGGIDLLDLGDAVFIHSTEKELSTLTEWGLKEGHLALRKSLRGVYLSQYAAELVAALVEEHDPHPDLFDLMAALLEDLQTARREESFLAFQLVLLRMTGHLPELWRCGSCHRPAGEASYFSVGRAAVVCRNCEGVVHDRMGIDSRLVRLMQTLVKNPGRLPQLSRFQTDPINRVLAEHVEHTLGKRLRVTRFVLGATGVTQPTAVLARA